MICPNCGTEFTPRRSSQKYCTKRCGVSSWKKSNAERNRAVQARYEASEAGKEVRKASEARYRGSEKGKAAQAKYQAEYAASGEGKTVRARYVASGEGKTVRARYGASEKGKAAQTRWRNSEKGRLAHVKFTARRRCRAPDEYINWFDRLLFRRHRPCAKCGKPWELSHELDHIVPLALGGKDEESNYQVLCVDCHRTKNGEDMRQIWKARRRQSLVGIAGGV